MTVFKKAKKLAFLLVRQKLKSRKYNVILLGSIAFSFVLVVCGMYSTLATVIPQRNVLGTSIAAPKAVLISPVAEITPIPPTPTFTLTPTPTIVPTPTTKPKRRVAKATPTDPPTNINPTQYTAEKISDTTWRVKNVANDNSMASAEDIVNALNSYRGVNGKSNLLVDINLSELARTRADKFGREGSLDSHAGFHDYMNNGGFEKSGFNSLGENSAFISGPMNGEKIIKSIFGADPSHDGNQLNDWTHVGVGVNGNAINVNFGKNKR